MKYCLLTEACRLVYYSSQRVTCQWYAVPEVRDTDNRTGHVLYQRREDRVSVLLLLGFCYFVDNLRVELIHMLHNFADHP